MHRGGRSLASRIEQLAIGDPLGQALTKEEMQEILDSWQTWYEDPCGWLTRIRSEGALTRQGDEGGSDDLASWDSLEEARDGPDDLADPSDPDEWISLDELLSSVSLSFDE